MTFDPIVLQMAMSAWAVFLINTIFLDCFLDDSLQNIADPRSMSMEYIG